MSEKHGSQPQQKPGSQSQQESVPGSTVFNDAASAASDAARRQVGRFSAFLAEAAAIEARTYERTVEAIHESSRLQAEALQYGLELAREARRFAVDAARRTAELWTPA